MMPGSELRRINPPDGEARGRPSLGGGWTLWPHVMVRAAGFPFAMLDETFRSAAPGEAVRRIVANPGFREAISWQNRPVLSRGIDPLLAAGPERDDAKTRKSRRLVAKYLQRYVAKCDTIGFFGPVGWGTIGEHGRFEPGAALLDGRSTFFEPWAIAALADAQMQARRFDAPVTFPGHLRMVGSTVHGPTGRWRLTAAEARMIGCANGRLARVILEELERCDAKTRWLAVLEKLAAEGWLRWRFPVSVSLDPGAPWRALGDCQELSFFDGLRARAAEAAGDERRLGAALERLENEFQRIAGRPAFRNHGRTYAGRALVYEECRRDIALDLGPTIIAQIGPALRVVLAIARWYTFDIAVTLARSCLQIFSGVRRKRIPLPVFWHLTEPLFAHELPPAVATTLERLRQKCARMWERAEARSAALHLTVAAAEAFVREHFRAPSPGWPGARHHSPDLMWSAADAQAFLQGQGVPVLAELHPGVTPFTTLAALALCPVREALAAEWRRDFPDPHVSPIPYEEFARSTLDPRLAPLHWHLDIGRDYVSERPPEQTLRAADFDVIARDERLLAVHDDNGLELDLMAVFERRIKMRAAVAYSLADERETGKRRFIGDVMIQRASWRAASPPIDAPYGPAGRARLRAWRSDVGLPDRVFVRVPSEIKPLYIDFESDLAVDLLHALCREPTGVTATEMYPPPSGLWLNDREGLRYVSELRLIAVDPVAYDSAALWSAAAAPADDLSAAAGEIP